MTSRPLAQPAVHVGRFPLEPIGAALPAILFGIGAISIPLAAAQSFGLSDGQTASLIIGLFGIPGVICLLIARVYRQPMLMAWHTSGLIFLTALSTQYSYPQVLGGMVVAGVLVLVFGVFGLSARMAALIPAPIVYGIVAGTMMPFVVRVFTEMTVYPLLIGSTVGTYVLARAYLPPTVPPVLPALLVCAGMALLTGAISGMPGPWALPSPEITVPAFSWQAIMSIAPVIAIFIGVQSNLTTSVYLRSQQYEPPDRFLNAVSGAGTSLGAFLGAVPIGSGSAVIAAVAGPDAGEHRVRYRSIYVCGVAWILIALGAGVVATIPAIVPLALLFALAGIALLGVLTQALTEITRGPVRVGPLFAFIVASSQLTLFGLGPLFWALVIGTAVTLALEKDGYASARAGS
jgi:benzoate membrane transport protein